MQTLNISDEIAQKIDMLACKMHLSKEDCIKEALEAFLEDRLDYFAALESFEDGGPTHTLEEVRAELGIVRD